jgi:hypothetical protein
MPAPDILAAQFARCVELFRDPSAKDGQKAEFRALLNLLQHDGLSLQDDGVRVVVNGVSVESPAMSSLAHRLAFHNVSEITVPRDPPANEVFELVKALSEHPSMEDVSSRLRALGAGSVSVTLAHLAGPGQASPAAAAPAEPPEHVTPTPTRDEDPPPGRVRPPGGAQTTDGLLQELEHNPQHPKVGDLLAVLSQQVDDAVRAGHLDQALPIVAVLVRAEARVPEGSARRQYGIALKRIYTKTMLQGLTRLLAAPKHRSEVVVVLGRGGADAVEMLLGLLVTAAAIGERRALFDALRQSNPGKEQLVPLLHHEQWFVVRNVAELIGELAIEEAVPALAQCLGHADERVRKAVALALVKIGTRSTGEPLRRALKDKARDVRMQVALGVGGRRSSALAMPLVVALEEEQDPEVRRELILALGRIGTPDAVQALTKVAQPSGRLFGRTPTPLRVAAVEALRLAATPAALGTLKGLTGGGDRQVKEAALAAVVELRKKK